MGANTTQFNTKYGLMISVMKDIYEAINELNMKDWSGVDQEEFETRAAQATLVGTADVVNVTTTKTSSNTVATPASVNTVFTATEQLETPVLAAIEALNEKNWELADRQIAIVVTAVATLSAALTAFDAASSVTATVGADKGDCGVLLVGQGRFKGILDGIVPMLNARRNKEYVEVNRLFAIEYPGVLAALTATARNNT